MDLAIGAAPTAAKSRPRLGVWRATRFCGNDISSSVLYVSALAAAHAGFLAPVGLMLVRGVSFLYRCQWFNVLNCRSERQSAFSLSVLRNPWLVGGLAAGNLLQVLVVFWAPLGAVFHTVPLAGAQVVQLALVGSLVL